MGMTMTQKILADHAGLKSVRAGELIEAKLDCCLGNDVTVPPAIEIFRELGVDTVFDRDRVCLIQDHFTPNKDIKSAALCSEMRKFAHEQNVSHYYELGRREMGIEHVILPDNGIVFPGDGVIGADSHTCTYGALGAFSTGVGSTDLACAMARGKTWFKVPQAIRVVLHNAPRDYVTGKDIILHLIGMIGVDGALYKSLEFCGDGVQNLRMSDRFTICNMAIECGAKNGIFHVDNVTLDYIAGTNPSRFSRGEYSVRIADADAEYDRVIDINLDDVPLTVALPHLPSNTRRADEIHGMKIDQVVIGSCTNGRLDDIEMAAGLFAGRHVADNVRCIIIPGSSRVYRQALDKGWLAVFDDAGCVISTPTCGPCLGGHMGVLAANERCVSTTNRNFVGRMGDKSSEVILSGVPVACASAIAGRVATPSELGIEGGIV
ncbi:MAG: 3-isopropylmalate dehydratase large subunit [Saccharofermentans sp.]|jgi:3-isopropylmalate/(R)-2-methylmalate dehydratase large subunit|nr:3-isopropylmalate dehydratase large subunit [Mageeibacillus sp.]MCI1263893.1 3-isopropylmalate dehydratase large subunit [Saccharofermentans sp.]MCI1275650.1 3-isopropylmalate dehydratase large subunit [Saccharofermentans sp.]MCI1769765.1 3-isopropylmalate dehydratase large subunit [Mageeibacillus sp.]MCI2043757.1 3-isopropylmalate dehydratase large subunit [Mageeibacillus sp.]